MPGGTREISPYRGCATAAHRLQTQTEDSTQSPQSTKYSRVGMTSVQLQAPEALPVPASLPILFPSNRVKAVLCGGDTVSPVRSRQIAGACAGTTRSIFWRLDRCNDN